MLESLNSGKNPVGRCYNAFHVVVLSTCCKHSLWMRSLKLFLVFQIELSVVVGFSEHLKSSSDVKDGKDNGLPRWLVNLSPFWTEDFSRDWPFSYFIIEFGVRGFKSLLRLYWTNILYVAINFLSGREISLPKFSFPSTDSGKYHNISSMTYVPFKTYEVLITLQKVLCGHLIIYLLCCTLSIH